MLDEAVLVTQKTRLDELLERHNTRAQAEFYVTHMGLDFADYAREHDTYAAAVGRVRRALEALVPRVQVVERSLLATFTFRPRDFVVAVGRDGLVVNVAKYVDDNLVVGVNPDSGRWDGVLLPFSPGEAGAAARAVLAGSAAVREVSMAEARLNDGQLLLAFNDFLVGRRDHASARYDLAFRGRHEEQSSSGVLVSTGAGSTGWLSSTLNMARAVSGLVLGDAAPGLPDLRLAPDAPRLAFVVREPFLSRSSGVQLTAGVLEQGESLRIESHMAEGGVVFSDGVAADALAFDAGMVATIGLAARRTRLVTRA